MTSSLTSSSRGVRVAAYLLAAAGLALALFLKLVWALFAGLLVHELVQGLARNVPLARLDRRVTKVLAVSALAIIVVGSLVGLGLLALAFVRSEQGSLSGLVGKLADIVERSRHTLPSWLASRLPEDATRLNEVVVEELRGHAGDLQLWGARAARAGAHIAFGMIIGAILALREETGDAEPEGPLAAALVVRLRRLTAAFRRVVFAQVLIAATNAGLTAIYLAVLLPILGVHLPFTKTLIAFTFVAGLVPVVGNLVSNAAITVAGLSHSLGVAAGSLAYLVVIHKLEYFLNARIIGGQIEARAWELLLAMLLMESAFGLPGVVAAPILYAYVKAELKAEGLV